MSKEARLTMRDTIGAHLTAVVYRSRAGFQHSDISGRCFIARLDERARYHETEACRHEGAAAGHAFRPAELAYDTGQGHGSAVTANAAFRGLGWPNRIIVDGETSVHWDGDE